MWTISQKTPSAGRAHRRDLSAVWLMCVAGGFKNRYKGVAMMLDGMQMYGMATRKSAVRLWKISRTMLSVEIFGVGNEV